MSVIGKIGSAVAVAVGGALTVLLAACAGPEPPDWKVNASSASEAFVDAWLIGNNRIEQLQFERAREATARTGRPDLVARIELLRCATRVASLVFEPCTGFEALRSAVPAGPETAYADYLAGRAQPAQTALLPEAQKAAAQSSGADDAHRAALLRDIADPLSRLVAAGVMFRSGNAGDEVIETAVETASAQGWRRPLLAWLIVKARRADAAGDAAAAAVARRRIELIAPAKGEGPEPPAANRR